jgi:hypothetical protein
LNKPVLIFALPGARDQIPWDISQYRVYYGPISDIEVLRKHIATIKAGVLQSRPQPPVIPTSQPLGERAEGCRERFLTAVADSNSESLSAAIRQLLAEVGFDALTMRDPETGEVEAAVWTNEWTPWISNPLVLDIRAPRVGPPTVESLTRFSDSLADRSIGWGLLLASSFTTEVVQNIRRISPHILLLAYDDLFEQLRTASFPRIVVSLRNQRVHGEG